MRERAADRLVEVAQVGDRRLETVLDSPQVRTQSVDLRQGRVENGKWVFRAVARSGGARGQFTVTIDIEACTRIICYRTTRSVSRCGYAVRLKSITYVSRHNTQAQPNRSHI